jgi:hypothetical protein
MLTVMPDRDLRERLRHEQQDEPVDRWSPIDEETGIPKYGEL